MSQQAQPITVSTHVNIPSQHEQNQQDKLIVACMSVVLNLSEQQTRDCMSDPRQFKPGDYYTKLKTIPANLDIRLSNILFCFNVLKQGEISGKTVKESVGDQYPIQVEKGLVLVTSRIKQFDELRGEQRAVIILHNIAKQVLGKVCDTLELNALKRIVVDRAFMPKTLSKDFLDYDYTIAAYAKKRVKNANKRVTYAVDNHPPGLPDLETIQAAESELKTLTKAFKEGRVWEKVELKLAEMSYQKIQFQGRAPKRLDYCAEARLAIDKKDLRVFKKLLPKISFRTNVSLADDSQPGGLLRHLIDRDWIEGTKLYIELHPVSVEQAQYACEKGSNEIVTLCLKRCNDFSPSSTEKYYLAAIRGDNLPELACLLEKAPLNQESFQEYLEEAATSQAIDTLKLLLSQGRDVSPSLLSVAIRDTIYVQDERGFLETVNLLIDYFKERNSLPNDLFYDLAATSFEQREGLKQLVQTLQRLGLRFDQPEKDPILFHAMTPVIPVYRYPSAMILDFPGKVKDKLIAALIVSGANPKAKNQNGDTLAHVLFTKNFDADSFLYTLDFFKKRCKVDFRSKNNKGQTVLHCFAQCLYIGQAQYQKLFEIIGDADLLTQDNEGKTPVDYAKHQRSEMQQFMEEKLKEVDEYPRNQRRRLA